MKTLEQIVTSKDVSQELKKAGYPQEGLWWWDSCKGEGRIVDKHHKKWVVSMFNKCVWEDMVVAPTVAEGLDKLPDKLEFNVRAGGKKVYWLTILKIGCHWHISYRLDYRHIDNAEYCGEVDTNLANAIHNMWLYLKKENKL